ncbi:MAG TPA: CDP-alcohol phosphatidyltransferase family protein [Gaiellaceae bacterium]|nr:CDP-alcohol phosphatidyltransferase family protein [Gaiellaceae bacterium]
MTPPPIREAIIVAEAGDPLRPVAREPLLVRTILALQRAGIERCTLVGRLPLPADRRIRCALVRTPALTPPADDALRLLVGTGAVIDPALVRELQTRARPGDVLEIEDDGVAVRVAPGPRIAGNGGMRLRPQSGTLRRADGAGVEGALLRALENPRDGYLDRLLHRRLSRPLTRILLRTPLSPNAVTVVGILVGATGGLLLGAPGPLALLAALALLTVSGVLDCSDGELARLRFAESRLGHLLDIGGDTLVHLAVLAGIAMRIARDGDAPGWPVLGALLLGIVGAFAVITWSEETEERRRRVAGWENRVLDGVLSPLTTRDWHVFPLLFALAGRLDLLVPAAAVGAHAFWIGTLVVVVRALRRAAV